MTVVDPCSEPGSEPEGSANDTKSMDDYRAKVRRMMQDARTRPTGVFSNRGSAHARIVVDTMLEAATNSIDVYSCGVNRAVYDAAKIIAFLERYPSGQARFLVEAADVWQSGTSALAELRGTSGALLQRLEVRLRSTQDLVEHLLIVDGVHIRVETSQETREAIVSFGDAKVIGNASTVFEKLWASGRPLPRPTAS